MFPFALIGRRLEELKRLSVLTLEKAERLAMVNRVICRPTSKGIGRPGGRPIEFD